MVSVRWFRKVIWALLVPQRPPASRPTRQTAPVPSRVSTAEPYRYHSRPPPRLPKVRLRDLMVTGATPMVGGMVGLTTGPAVTSGLGRIRHPTLGGSLPP